MMKVEAAPLVVESTPKSDTQSSQFHFSRRAALVACIGAAMVLGAVVFVYNDVGASPTTYDGSPRRSSSTCTSESLAIKSYSSGYYLKSGTISGSSAEYANPSSYTSSYDIPTWDIVGVNSANTSYYIKTSSGMYLTLSCTSTSSFSSIFGCLSVQSTASPGTSAQWYITEATAESDCTKRYYVAPVNYDTYYLKGGTWYVALSYVASGTEGSMYTMFTIQTTGGTGPCVTSTQDTCVAEAYCKTGLSVLYSNTSLGNESTSANEDLETAAQTTCNDHCLNCDSWDTNCKACGGTIDTGSHTTGSNGGVYRQCNCDSAFKTASISLVAMLVVLANFMGQL